ncbi:MAG: hypothetical protein IKU29_01580 [Parabacteroides sp.]|nr:hypothetical protein [Parabacteroides sp.]
MISLLTILLGAGGLSVPGMLLGNEVKKDLTYTLFDFSDSKNMSGKMIKSFESDFDPLLTLCDLSSFIR